MNRLVIRHKVENFADWKRAFVLHADARVNHGLKLLNVMRNVDEPTEIVVALEVEDPEMAREYVKSVSLRNAMKDAGVKNEIEIFYGQTA